MFPFLLDSIETQWSQDQAIWADRVSIPLRFDWNTRFVFLCLEDVQVSIPLRFDWNQAQRTVHSRRQQFPFLLDSIETEKSEDRIEIEPEFPFLLDSIETSNAGSGRLQARNWFPFLLDSIETYTLELPAEEVIHSFHSS